MSITAFQLCLCILPRTSTEKKFAVCLLKKKLQASSQKLYFSRDPLGRRSLLLHRPTRDLPYFLLSSVSTGNNSDYKFEELSVKHIYSVDFKLLMSAYHGVRETFFS